MSQTNTPAFALVGHANKGKSSIVSTLAYDDSVKISNIPGETKQANVFHLTIDGHTLYKLYDTPGFQDAHGVLRWLREHETVSKEHFDTLKKFVGEHQRDAEFTDEIELLTPIINGAAIIYVIDCSNPYSEEQYEAEMEILRWSGNPSMALINKKKDASYINDWRKALNQHFKMVREFNPLKVSFQDKLELLDAMAQLDPAWTKNIKRSIEVLKQDHSNRIKDTAELIVENICKSISHTMPVEDENRERLANKYLAHLIRLEDETYKKVEERWGHYRLHSSKDNSGFDRLDLFSEEAREKHGLSKRSLVLVSALSGATTAGAAGFAISAPTSLLDFGAMTTATTTLSALGGGLAGAVGGLFGHETYVNITTSGKIFGNKKQQIGPMKDEGFPYILLSRSLHHANIVANRSHAQRDAIKFESAEDLLVSDEKKTLAKLHSNFRRNKNIEESKEEYMALVKVKIENKILDESL